MSVYRDALTGAPGFGRPKDVTKDPRRRCKALIANKELGDEEAFLEGREMLMTQLLKTAREQNRVLFLAHKSAQVLTDRSKDKVRAESSPVGGGVSCDWL